MRSLEKASHCLTIRIGLSGKALTFNKQCLVSVTAQYSVETQMETRRVSEGEISCRFVLANTSGYPCHNQTTKFDEEPPKIASNNST